MMKGDGNWNDIMDAITILSALVCRDIDDSSTFTDENAEAEETSKLCGESNDQLDHNDDYDTIMDVTELEDPPSRKGFFDVFHINQKIKSVVEHQRIVMNGDVETVQVECYDTSPHNVVSSKEVDDLTTNIDYKIYKIVLDYCIQQASLSEGTCIPLEKITRSIYLRYVELKGRLLDLYNMQKVGKIIFTLMKATTKAFLSNELFDYSQPDDNILATIPSECMKIINKELLNFLKHPKRITREILQKKYKLHLPDADACEEEKLYYLILEAFKYYDNGCRADTKLGSVCKDRAKEDIKDDVVTNLESAYFLFRVCLKWLGEKEKDTQAPLSLKDLSMRKLLNKLPRIQTSNLLAADLNRRLCRTKLQAGDYLKTNGRARPVTVHDTVRMRQLECNLTAAMIQYTIGDTAMAYDHIMKISKSILNITVCNRTASKIICEEAKINLYMDNLLEAIVNLQMALNLDKTNEDAIAYSFLISVSFSSVLKDNQSPSETSTISDWLRHPDEICQEVDSYEYLADFVAKLPQKNGKAKLYILFFTARDFTSLQAFPELSIELKFLMGFVSDKQLEAVVSPDAANEYTIKRVPIPSRILFPYLLLVHKTDSILEERCLKLLQNGTEVSSERCRYLSYSLYGHALYNTAGRKEEALRQYRKAVRHLDGNGSVIVKNRLRCSGGIKLAY